MTLYKSIQEFIEHTASVDSWPDIVTVMARAVRQEPRDWQLPLIACEAVGGSSDAVVPVLSAVACAHISLILVDDLLDADPRGEHHRLGMPLTANLATVFQNLALDSLRQEQSMHPDVRLLVADSLHQMMLTTALGQYLDVQNPADEVTYWRIVHTKSAPFFDSAFYVGAVVGGAPPKLAHQLGQLGRLYGEMIQIHDDLSDSLATPASPDWVLGRCPLPLLFAQVVKHPDRARFLDLRHEIADPQALAEAQSILIRCGALSYGIYELLERYQKARSLLKTLAVPRAAGLEALLEGQVKPVQQIFATLGEKAPPI